MGKKYLEKSAEVLSEADRLEGIMNWQLFCYEQERLQTAFLSPVVWEPGEFLYPHPYHLDEGEIEGSTQYVRRMIQEIDETKSHWLMACEDCEVSWDLNMTRTCWMCGNHIERKFVEAMDSQKTLDRQVYEREHRGPMANFTLDRYGNIHMFGVDWPRVERPATRSRMIIPNSFSVRTFAEPTREITFRVMHNVPVTVWDNVWAEVFYDIDYDAYRFYLEAKVNGKMYHCRVRMEADDISDGLFTEKDIFATLIENIMHMASTDEGRG